MTKIFLLIFIILQIFKSELLFVIQIHRHGARVPKEPFYDEKEQKKDKGELTATGIRQHYNFGSLLKEKYSNFLPNQYNSTQIYVRASDVNRTLMSAQANLQGLFPEGTGQKLPEGLQEKYKLSPYKNQKDYLPEHIYALPNNIQIIPIHTVSQKQDLVLQSYQNCANMRDLEQQYYQENKQIVDFVNQQFNQTYKILSDIVQKEINNFDDAREVETVFKCDQFNGRYVPQFSQEFSQNLTFLTSLSWNFEFNQKMLLRALNTPFIGELFKFFDNKIKKINDDLKWVMFSGHDDNVQMINAAFNFTSIECLMNRQFGLFPDRKFLNCVSYPQFASSLLIELYQADQDFFTGSEMIMKGEFYVKILFDGEYMNLCEKANNICKWNELRQRLQTFQTDFNQVCDKKEKLLLQKQVFEEQEENKNIFEEIININNIIFGQNIIITFIIIYVLIKKFISF